RPSPAVPEGAVPRGENVSHAKTLQHRRALDLSRLTRTSTLPSVSPAAFVAEAFHSHLKGEVIL
ncbi:hypothetical protein LEMLEM_LOCUS7579, partial [Lemmus lemmus]